LYKSLVIGVIILFISMSVQPVISIEIKNTNNLKMQKTMSEGNHLPIYIEGNDDFTSENGVTGGSGTEDDPYIIENWIIVGNASYLWGIYIEDSTVHFIIRNCSISGFNRYSAIELFNVRNGKLIENFCSDNLHSGIHLGDCDNNEIIGASIIGPHATELIAALTLAVQKLEIILLNDAFAK